MAKPSGRDCLVEGCYKPARGRYCSMHAERLRLYGDLHYKKSYVHDLSGQRFGRLIAVEQRPNSKGGQTMWACKCDCGGDAVVQAGNLKSGHTQSCGCITAENPNQRTHGMSKTPTYRSWIAMRRRCYDENYIEFHLYGGRGIKVCDRWKDNFENFYTDMGERPDGMTLDRYPDHNGHYEPSNCRWATPAQQASNTRKNPLPGMTLKDACKLYGISENTVLTRKNRLGWDLERALLTPPQRRKK